MAHGDPEGFPSSRADRAAGRAVDKADADRGMNKSEVAQAKSEARSNPANQNPARSNTNTGPTQSSSTSRPTNVGSRSIVGLMFFAVAFALVGNEIKISNGNAGAVTKQVGLVTEGSRIVLGGVFATTFLVLISHAGSGGQQLATGLALVTTATSLLVYGGPVWSAAGAIFGTTKGTTPSAGTSATAATSPTSAAGADVAAFTAVA